MAAQVETPSAPHSYAPAARSFEEPGPGLRLYESGALRGKQLLLSEKSGAAFLPVVIVDRSPSSELMFAALLDLAQFDELKRWKAAGGAGYAVIHAKRSFPEMWCGRRTPYLG